MVRRLGEGRVVRKTRVGQVMLHNPGHDAQRRTGGRRGGQRVRSLIALAMVVDIDHPAQGAFLKRQPRQLRLSRRAAGQRDHQRIAIRGLLLGVGAPIAHHPHKCVFEQREG